MKKSEIRNQKSKSYIKIQNFEFLIVILIFAFCILNFLGCGQKVESFGDAPDVSSSKTAIGTILVNPQNFLDKEVVIEGVIASECPTGGWINVQDTSGATIYVEMHGASFAPIPQRVGRQVLTKGVVYQSQGASKETKLLGKGLTIK